MPKYESLYGKFPKGCSVVLAPTWLVNKLEENHVSLDCLIDGSLPNILSGDELIYYYNYYRTPRQFSKQLAVINDLGHSFHREYPEGHDFWSLVSLEQKRLNKIFDNEAYVQYAMSVIGPDMDLTKPCPNKGVELKTIRQGNHLIVTFGPAEETPDHYTASKEVYKYLSDFIPTETLLKTSLYAYLLLGPTKFRCETLDSY